MLKAFQKIPTLRCNFIKACITESNGCKQIGRYWVVESFSADNIDVCYMHRNLPFRQNVHITLNKATTKTDDTNKGDWPSWIMIEYKHSLDENPIKQKLAVRIPNNLKWLCPLIPPNLPYRNVFFQFNVTKNSAPYPSALDLANIQANVTGPFLVAKQTVRRTIFHIFQVLLLSLLNEWLGQRERDLNELIPLRNISVIN